MTYQLAFGILLLYFGILIAISWITSRGATTETFFTANKSSPWYLVAYGMIGASLSGITFVSVPGNVATSNFSYFQMVLGYIPGYLFIVYVLLPLYYKLNLISIYSYFENRFGRNSYLTASFFFLVSRTIGASFRLYITAMVLQMALFSNWGIPFYYTVGITLVLIWVYTIKGGIKTIVWTDTFQTTFLVGAVVLCIVQIMQAMAWDLPTLFYTIRDSKLTTIFVWEANSPQFFVRQFVSGAFIAIVMTGMDQDLMQKNLTCKTLSDAQKNMLAFIGVLVVVNFLFLCLGFLLYEYANAFSIALPQKTDDIFPYIAFKHLGTVAAIFFLLGITASSYASADSALASLTTAFCIDFLNFKTITDEKIRDRLKWTTHVGFTILIFVCILVFEKINDTAVINAVFKVAGYTYGPLLGMFFFGLFTNKKPYELAVPFISVAIPIFWYFLQQWIQAAIGFTIGFELLLYNGTSVFIGLLISSWFSKKI